MDSRGLTWKASVTENHLRVTEFVKARLPAGVKSRQTKKSAHMCSQVFKTTCCCRATRLHQHCTGASHHWTQIRKQHAGGRYTLLPRWMGVLEIKTATKSVLHYMSDPKMTRFSLCWISGMRWMWRCHSGLCQLPRDCWQFQQQGLPQSMVSVLLGDWLRRHWPPSIHQILMHFCSDIIQGSRTLYASVRWFQ